MSRKDTKQEPARKRRKQDAIDARAIPPGGYDVYAIASMIPVKLGHVEIREDDRKGYGALSVAGYVSPATSMHTIEIGEPGKMRDFMDPDARLPGVEDSQVLPLRVGGYGKKLNGGRGRFKPRYSILLVPDRPDRLTQPVRAPS